MKLYNNKRGKLTESVKHILLSFLYLYFHIFVIVFVFLKTAAKSGNLFFIFWIISFIRSHSVSLKKEMGLCSGGAAIITGIYYS